MRSNYNNISYTKNENESYFTYSLYTTIVSRFVLDVSGQIKLSSWAADTKNWSVFWYQPRQHCDVYAFCGAFGICNKKDGLPICTCLDGFKPRSPEEWNLADYSGGCLRKAFLQCGVENGFMKVRYRPLGSNNLSSIETVENCKLACLNNCSCNAYASTLGV
ncbi:hypothetical protein IFM89_033899 [Coptis chinensis]|uniref:Apple domain-containing protein n=1 Tax=Coptis chinensis TaxID=261450 RepID=A0A835H2H7_9MAGN|nr:hypothetical protein IFM89_033899 [Coptis chinensis]